MNLQVHLQNWQPTCIYKNQKLYCFLGSIKFCICKQYLRHSTSNCNLSLKECLLRRNHLTFWWKDRFSLLTTSRACHSKLWPIDACHALYTQCNHHNINGSLCKCKYAKICAMNISSGRGGSKFELIELWSSTLGLWQGLGNGFHLNDWRTL